MLSKIGHQLDEDIFPSIMCGGIVTPSESAAPSINWAKENDDERQRARRPETRAWQWPSGGKRQTNRGWTSSASTPPICTELKAKYHGELLAVYEAYPGTQVWHQTDGLWLLTESSLLPELCQKAVFLTGIPFSRTRLVRSWGFWMGAPLRYPKWIGPRHTNLPDGSICAFEPTDGTWRLGDSLLLLLDLYTLWALRHLHLQVFKRWPGRQVAHFVHERLTELQPTEFCGCGAGKLYGECCQEEDLKSNRVLEAMRFYDLGGERVVPELVKSFIRGQKSPPSLMELLPYS